MVEVSYHTLNGQIRSAGSSSAGNIHMLRDGLGSVIQTFNFLNSVALSQRFAPYGTAVLQSSGQPQFSTDMRMGWVGSQGYRRTSMTNSERYVRARHYSSKSGRWTTKDPLWPQEEPFSYVNGWPTTATDSDGEQAVVAGLGAIAAADEWNPVGWCITIGLGCYLVYKLCDRPNIPPITIPWPGRPAPAPPPKPDPEPTPWWPPFIPDPWNPPTSSPKPKPKPKPKPRKPGKNQKYCRCYIYETGPTPPCRGQIDLGVTVEINGDFDKGRSECQSLRSTVKPLPGCHMGHIGCK